MSGRLDPPPVSHPDAEALSVPAMTFSLCGRLQAKLLPLHPRLIPRKFT